MSAPLSQEQKIIHFLNRTSFGPTRNDVQRATRIGIRAYLDEQLAPERLPDSVAEEKVAGLKTMRLSSRELIELYPPPRVQRQQANQAGGMAMQASEHGGWLTYTSGVNYVVATTSSRRSIIG